MCLCVCICAREFLRLQLAEPIATVITSPISIFFVVLVVRYPALYRLLHYIGTQALKCCGFSVASGLSVTRGQFPQYKFVQLSRPRDPRNKILPHSAGELYTILIRAANAGRASLAVNFIRNYESMGNLRRCSRGRLCATLIYVRPRFFLSGPLI